MREVEVGSGKALLVKQLGVFSAIGHKCTHYGAPLVKGTQCIACCAIRSFLLTLVCMSIGVHVEHTTTLKALDTLLAKDQCFYLVYPSICIKEHISAHFDSIGHQSCKRLMKEKHPWCTNLRTFRSFSKTKVVQRDSFVTMFYTMLKNYFESLPIVSSAFNMYCCLSS